MTKAALLLLVSPATVDTDKTAVLVKRLGPEASALCSDAVQDETPQGLFPRRVGAASSSYEWLWGLLNFMAWENIT